MTPIKLYDTVALLQDIQTTEFMTTKPILLRCGQVGAAVEEYENGQAFEVEFSDQNGQPYALLAIPADNLMPLYHEAVDLSVARL